MTALKLDRIPLDAIRLDGDTQARVQTNEEHVNDICDAIVAEVELPPVILFHDGTNYWPGDGHHRILAHRKMHRKDIAAEVQPGDQRAAILYACGANAEHLGLRRSNADKHRAVETLLLDVQDGCRAGHKCDDLPPSERCWSRWNDSEIARRCRVDHKTVAKLRPPHLGKSQDSSVRVVERSGTTYTQDTTNIGRGRQPANIQAAAAREKEQQRRAVDRSVSQETYADDTPTSPLTFRSAATPAPSISNTPPAPRTSAEQGDASHMEEFVAAFCGDQNAVEFYLPLLREIRGTVPELVEQIDTHLRGSRH